MWYRKKVLGIGCHGARSVSCLSTCFADGCPDAVAAITKCLELRHLGQAEVPVSVDKKLRFGKSSTVHCQFQHPADLPHLCREEPPCRFLDHEPERSLIWRQPAQRIDQVKAILQPTPAPVVVREIAEVYQHPGRLAARPLRQILLAPADQELQPLDDVKLEFLILTAGLEFKSSGKGSCE